MLFFIAMKCPDKRLCKKATELLRVSHRREGTWDSETCLRIVEYSIARKDADKASGVAVIEQGAVGIKSPESASSTSPDAAIDFELVLRDERARRYIEAGREEAARLQRSAGMGSSVRHSLLYL